jgi:hypothetical protein
MYAIGRTAKAVCRCGSTVICVGCALLLCTPRSDRITPAHNTDIHTGDIVFLAGNSLRSQLVRLLEPGDGTLSHVGIAVWGGDTLSIIHASPPHKDRSRSCVSREPLDSLILRLHPRTIAVYRVGTDSSVIAAAARWATIHSDAGTPFDDRFSLQSDSALYCTELIYKAFVYAGVSLTDVTPDTISTLFGTLEVLFPATLTASASLHPIY